MSLIPNNYDSIVSAIKALAEDDSTEFENYIPTAIFLAEERLVKEVDLEGLSFIASVTASACTQLLAKPSGYRLGHNLYFQTSSSTKVLEKQTESFILDYWPNQNNTGVPKYYADRNSFQWWLAPTPASAYVFSTTYTKKPEKLTTNISTNFFTENAPDALYYATMSNMAEFMKDYGTRQVWESKYEMARDGLLNQARRERRDENSGRPEYGATNVLKDGNT